jgi:hypothetical protein
LNATSGSGGDSNVAQRIDCNDGARTAHAVEIAGHPEVINASDVLRLYRQIAIGRCCGGLSEECETARALATEAKVANELFASARESAYSEQNEGR